MSTTVAEMPQHLVGTAEIAEMFDVSRQYVDRLTRSASFPAPEVELASGRVWSREAVETWARDFRKHFCLPVGGPERHGRATIISCHVCGRLWKWDGTGSWKNTTPPPTPDERA
jgi:predicted DNA-binding transcriptional regulator AlpA